MKLDEIKELAQKAFELEKLQDDITQIQSATSLDEISTPPRVSDTIDFPAIQNILIAGISKRIEVLQAEIDAV